MFVEFVFEFVIVTKCAFPNTYKENHFCSFHFHYNFKNKC